MDPFDEFEFKPITEGLGFHLKKNTPPAQKSESDFDFIEETLSEKSNSSAFLVKPPLPREPSFQSPMQKSPLQQARQENNARTTDTVDEILRTLNEKKKFEQAEINQQFHQETASVPMKTSRFEISAALLDFMLITAGFLTSLIILLVVTKVDLISNLLNPDEGSEIYFGTVGLLAVIVWIYLVINRVFLGCTPGEWVFDQQLGKDNEVGTGLYSLKVAFRSFLIIATGLVPFPLLSMISGHDLIGKLTGTQVYKRV